MKAKRNVLPGAALLALLAAVIVYCILLHVEKNALADYEKKLVVTAIDRIPKGKLLTAENVQALFAEKEMEAAMVPEHAIEQWEELYGQMAAINLEKGTVITASLLTDPQTAEREMREPVTAGFKAEDLYQVVGGVLRKGDRIHLYTVEPGTGQTYLIWENVMVQEVFDSSGVVIPTENQTLAAQRINILLEKEDVEQFYSELAMGSLRVVKAMQ